MQFFTNLLILLPLALGTFVTAQDTSMSSAYRVARRSYSGPSPNYAATLARRDRIAVLRNRLRRRTSTGKHAKTDSSGSGETIHILSHKDLNGKEWPTEAEKNESNKKIKDARRKQTIIGPGQGGKK